MKKKKCLILVNFLNFFLRLVLLNLCLVEKTINIKKMKFLWILIVLINYRVATEAKYQHNNVFKEELVVKELKDSFVNTYFQFTTQWNFKTNERKKTIDFFF